MKGGKLEDFGKRKTETRAQGTIAIYILFSFCLYTKKLW